MMKPEETRYVEDVPNPGAPRRVRRGSTPLAPAVGLVALCVSLTAQAPSVPRAGQASAVTATLSDRVVDFTTNEPVPGVLVQIGGPAKAARITAENGTFEFTNLPAGSYYVTARRNGYLPDFGSPRPGARGRTTVDLEPGGRGIPTCSRPFELMRRSSMLSMARHERCR